MTIPNSQVPRLHFVVSPDGRTYAPVCCPTCGQEVEVIERAVIDVALSPPHAALAPRRVDALADLTLRPCGHLVSYVSWESAGQAGFDPPRFVDVVAY